MEIGMTNAELNSFLEVLAKLVECKAMTVDEAAELIRSAKTTATNRGEPYRLRFKADKKKGE